MKQYFITPFILFLALKSFSQISCQAPSWDGIRVGVTKEREVIKKYGKGKFLRDGGHGGGLAYLDSTKEIELIIEIGVDNIIECLTLKRIDSTDSIKGIPVSYKVNKNAFFYKNKFTFNSHKHYVGKRLGEPSTSRKWGKKEDNEEDWTYLTDECEQFINIEVTIEFHGDNIYKISLENGE
jgi:hypothetical protein